MSSRDWLCLCAPLALLAGCTQIPGGGPSSDAFKALEARVTALEVRLEATDSELAKINENWVSRIELLQRIVALDLHDSSVVLQPVASGYGVVRNSHGLLAISFHDAAPIASGTRLKIGVINMMAVTLDDVALTVRYTTGARESLYGASSEAGAARELRKGLTQTLDGGTETIVTIDLPGVPPDKLTFFEVTPEVSAMRYR